MQETGAFNNDILLWPGDAELARKKYPLIADMLIWPELIKAFKPIDDEANARKKRSHRRGLQGLAFGLGSLILAVLDPYLHGGPAWLTHYPVVPVLGFVLLLSALLLGSHVLRGADRSAWLLNRLTTESLRQLHFQWLVRHATHIAAAAPDHRTELLKERNLLLDSLLHDLKDGSALHTVLEDRASAKWCKVEVAEPAPAPDAATLREFERAYAELRFDRQASYAGRMLMEDGHGFWPRSALGKAQRLAEVANALTVIGLIVAVVVLAVGVLHPPLHDEINTIAGAVALLVAMCVLALRVLDEGLRPRAEVARYRAYEAEIEELKRQFEEAHGDTAARLGVMASMEALSYREMRQFLAEHSEASFSF